MVGENISLQDKKVDFWTYKTVDFIWTYYDYDILNKDLSFLL